MNVQPSQIQAAERTLAAGTWAITGGAVLYSVLTVTPLVQRVTPNAWDWTAPILPLVVDAAVVIVVRLDSVVSRLGVKGGAWPAVLRWMTGLMTLLLNTGNSALSGDLVGVAVHSVAPFLLIVTAEAGLAYRRAIALGLERIAREQAAERERERTEQVARERREREEREVRERREREEREHEADRRERSEREEREHALRMAQQQADHARQAAQDQREHEARLAREQAAPQAQQRAAEQAQQLTHPEQEAPRERGREERELRERVMREDRASAVHVAPVIADRPTPQPRPAAVVNEVADTAAEPVNTESGSVNIPVFTGSEKVAEDVARKLIADPVNAGRSVRQLAEETGWSVGWVAARKAELREREQEDGDDAEAVA